MNYLSIIIKNLYEENPARFGQDFLLSNVL